MEINEEVKLLKEIVRDLHKMLGAVRGEVFHLSPTDFPGIWNRAGKTLDQLVVDREALPNAPMKPDACEEKADPDATEAMAMELHQKFGPASGWFEPWERTFAKGTFRELARHVIALRDEAVRKALHRGDLMEMTFKELACVQELVERETAALKSHHAAEAAKARREALVEACKAVCHGCAWSNEPSSGEWWSLPHPTSPSNPIRRLIAQLDAEEKG